MQLWVRCGIYDLWIITKNYRAREHLTRVNDAYVWFEIYLKLFFHHSSAFSSSMHSFCFFFDCVSFLSRCANYMHISISSLICDAHNAIVKQRQQLQIKMTIMSWQSISLPVVCFWANYVSNTIMIFFISSKEILIETFRFQYHPIFRSFQLH